MRAEKTGHRIQPCVPALAPKADIRATTMDTGDDEGRLPAEVRARTLIDQQLTQAGWKIQDKKDLNLFAGKGVGVREVVMKPGHGRVD